MIKVFFTLAALVTLLPAFSPAESPIDLGDVYIWGEDRSVLEGIRTEDLLLFPILNKAAFVGPYSGDVFEKGSPRTKVSPLDGLYLHGGWGSFDEYMFRAAHGLNLKPWAFNWHFRGSQRHYGEEESFNRRFSGLANVSYRPESFNLSSDVRGMADEGKISREFYQIQFRGASSLGRVVLQPEICFSPGKTAPTSVSQLGAGISADTYIAYYHRVGVKAQSRRTRVDEKESGFSRLSLNYSSRMFRDFNFSLTAGFLSGGGFEYGGGVSGDFLDTGYRLYLKKELTDFSLYDMVKKSDALVFENGISDEVNSEFGIEFFRDTGFAGVGELKMSNKKVEDKIVYVQNSGGIYNPVNHENGAEIFTVETALKNPPFYISLKYYGNRSGPRLPFYTNELNISFKPEIVLNFALLKFSSELSYRDNVKIWMSPCAGEKRTESPAAKLNAAAGLELDNGIFFRFGVTNILEERIVELASFPEEERRFYVMGGINFPVGD